MEEEGCIRGVGDVDCVCRENNIGFDGYDLRLFALFLLVIA